MIMALLAASAFISDTQAQAIVAGCATHAAAKRHSFAIAVVDPGGQLVAFRRMGGNSFGAGDFSIQKARAAAAWGTSTSELTDWLRDAPGLVGAPHFAPVAGGVPIFAKDGTRLGAAGASGEEPVDDEQCVKAGVAAAGLLSEPPASGGK